MGKSTLFYRMKFGYFYRVFQLIIEKTRWEGELSPASFMSLIPKAGTIINLQDIPILKNVLFIKLTDNHSELNMKYEKDTSVSSKLSGIYHSFISKYIFKLFCQVAKTDSLNYLEDSQRWFIISFIVSYLTFHMHDPDDMKRYHFQMLAYNNDENAEIGGFLCVNMNTNNTHTKEAYSFIVDEEGIDADALKKLDSVMEANVIVGYEVVKDRVTLFYKNKEEFDERNEYKKTSSSDEDDNKPDDPDDIAGGPPVPVNIKKPLADAAPALSRLGRR